MLTTAVILGHHKSHPYKKVNLNSKCCVCPDCSTDQPFPISLLLLGPLYSLRCNSIEITLTNNLPIKCPSERKSHMSLTLNQKLEMIKINEEDLLKAEIGGKLGFLHQAVSHVVNAKGESS